MDSEADINGDSMFDRMISLAIVVGVVLIFIVAYILSEGNK